MCLHVINVVLETFFQTFFQTGIVALPRMEKKKQKNNNNLVDSMLLHVPHSVFDERPEMSVETRSPLIDDAFLIPNEAGGKHKLQGLLIAECECVRHMKTD